MRHDHLKRELDLLLMLTQNRLYSSEEICERIGISQRSFYYYIEFFRQAGFKVERHGFKYSIDRSSHFFQQLFDLIQFTEDEALLMRQLIDNAESSQRLRDLQAKLHRFYDFNILENERLREKTSYIRSTLYNAVKLHRTVKICGYSSPSSHTVTDREVEPYLFLNNNNDIRCYEPASRKNKTFRLSRMEDVKMLSHNWQHEDMHRKAYSDLFSFTGDKVTTVSMLMGQLSHNLMLEEYPASAPCFAERSDGRWLFQTDVCSYLGIGRFILGLYDDIEVLSDDGLRQHLNERLRKWSQTLKVGSINSHRNK